MELILRSARPFNCDSARTFDIGIDGGRIAAIEPGLAAEARELELGGRLVPASFIDGCPLGLSIISRRGSDWALLALARQIMETTR